eukprot:c6841_g1_i1.p1 GENE.c6841_g1_i1~~c6841_g1_i1.p1  ORF type:complete len:109 (+),score=34.01 c6841_g1_i1:28-327(+)
MDSIDIDFEIEKDSEIENMPSSTRLIFIGFLFFIFGVYISINLGNMFTIDGKNFELKVLPQQQNATDFILSIQKQDNNNENSDNNENTNKAKIFLRNKK